MRSRGSAIGTGTVSVILNCLNGESYLRDALDSVVAQTYPDWEVVFFDDASVDGSVAIADAYGDRVRRFRAPYTLALGAARNAALAEARGSFIAFIDQDDVWLPDKLAKQLPLFDDPSVGLVFSDAFVFNDRGNIKRSMGGRQSQAGHDTFRGFLGDYRAVIDTVMIRRSVLDSMSEWFDPRFTYVEDADFFTRIAHDWRVAYVDEPLAKWRMHWDSWSFARRDLIALELSQMLEKFRNLYPGLEREFASEVATINDRIAYEAALTDWQRGAGAAARRQLATVSRRRARYWPAYVMSFGPYGLFESLNRWRWSLGW